jgi:hypothetical protein
MNSFLFRLQRRIAEDQFLGFVFLIGVVATLITLALYAYLGTFSRYGSDDYCLSAFFYQDNLLSAMVVRYFNASSRYTNILFIGLADTLFGWYNVAVLPALMLILFICGLYLLLKEINEMAQWGWNRWTIFFLSLLIVYFSITQAPDLYETLYWRAGMTSHFAPVVLIPFFGVFLLRQIQWARNHPPSPWVLAASFTIPLLLGGLSEPPTAVMITILGLAVAAVWWRGDVQYRRSITIILLCSLAGAIAALVIMAFAPANSIRMRTAPPGLLELINRIINYPIVFIVDTFRTLPTPTLVSVMVPAVLFYVKYVSPSPGTSIQTRNRLSVLMLIIFMLGYLLIAASFAPSAYGQSYPAARARFFGRVLMTMTLMTEGAFLGVLVAQVKSFQTAALRGLAALALLILVMYPLRTASKVFAEIPVYQQRSAAWDMRESEIHRLRADGVQDLVVRFLPAEISQDLGDQSDFRLNRCAATLYDVNSIVAVPIERE